MGAGVAKALGTHRAALLKPRDCSRRKDHRRDSGLRDHARECRNDSDDRRGRRRSALRNFRVTTCSGSSAKCPRRSSSSSTSIILPARSAAANDNARSVSEKRWRATPGRPKPTLSSRVGLLQRLSLLRRLSLRKSRGCQGQNSPGDSDSKADRGRGESGACWLTAAEKAKPVTAAYKENWNAIFAETAKEGQAMIGAARRTNYASGGSFNARSTSPVARSEPVLPRDVGLHQERRAAVEFLVLLMAAAELRADEVPDHPHQRDARLGVGGSRRM